MEPIVITPANYNDITFDLEIISMKVVNEPNIDTVHKIFYLIKGTDGVYSAEHNRTLVLDTEATENFIEYDNLTKNNVKNWIETLSNYELDKYSICNIILSEYKNTENTKNLPW